MSKVPEVTLLFWIIKIAATTLGETGGDAVSMSMNLGYLVATGIFARALPRRRRRQIAAKRFLPFLYWTTIIATTTVGTTLADFADRSLGIGYAGGSALLFALLHDVARGLVPHARLGVGGDGELAQGRDVLLGDDHVLADAGHRARRLDGRHGLGWATPAPRSVFGGLLALVAAAYFWTAISRTVLFWAAFILTRPLGAAVGDFLDKPVEQGRSGTEPILRVGRDSGLHRRLHRDLPAESRREEPLRLRSTTLSRSRSTASTARIDAIVELIDRLRQS